MDTTNFKTEINKDPKFNKHIDFILALRMAAYYAKQNRMNLNAENFNTYHFRQDWSYKTPGQSREFIGKQASITEEFTSFLQQGVVDQKEWFNVETLPGADPSVFTSDVIQKLLYRQLQKSDIYTFVGDMIKLGALGSLMIVKISSKDIEVPKFKVKREINADGTSSRSLIRETKTRCQLSLKLVRQEDYYPDPTGDGMYEIEEMEMDHYQLIKIAEANPDDYDVEAVRKLNASPMLTQRARRARETNQNDNVSLQRKRIKVTEYWGTLVEPNTGEILFDNCVCAFANDSVMIRPPKPNPLWHGESPYVVAPIIRVPKSVWHRALADAPTRHNLALNELYNLMLDGGMMEAHGIKQIHENWLEDPNQVADGIAAGDTVRVNANCPPGAKAIETVATGTVGPNAMQIFNVTYSELAAAYLSNQFRQGSVPERSVKATEVVASNNAITGVFSGMVKIIESGMLTKLLTKSWLTIAQYMDDLDDDEISDLLGKDVANKLLGISAEDRFSETATGYKFKVFGLSLVMNKINDFRKITTLLQTLASDPQLMAAFMQRFSMNKLLSEIVSSLDIDTDKISMTPQESAQQQAVMQQAQQQQSAQNPQGGGSQGSQSQIPQMASMSDRTAMDQMRSQMNQGMTRPGG